MERVREDREEPFRKRVVVDAKMKGPEMSWESLPSAEMQPGTVYSGNEAREGATQYNGDNTFYYGHRISTKNYYLTQEKRESLARDARARESSIFKKKGILIASVLLVLVVVILVPTLALTLTKDGKTHSLKAATVTNPASTSQTSTSQPSVSQSSTSQPSTSRPSTLTSQSSTTSTTASPSPTVASQVSSTSASNIPNKIAKTTSSPSTTPPPNTIINITPPCQSWGGCAGDYCTDFNGCDDPLVCVYSQCSLVITTTENQCIAGVEGAWCNLANSCCPGLSCPVTNSLETAACITSG